MSRKYKSERINKLLEQYSELENKMNNIEDLLSEAGLESGEAIHLGSYGSGRTLVLQDDHWSGRTRGEWLSSSETC